MKKTNLLIGLLILVVLISGCIKQTLPDKEPLPKEKLYFQDIIDVEFKSNITKEQAKAIIEFYNCTIIKESTDIRIKIPQNKTIFEMRDIFQNLTEVQFVSLILPTKAAI